MKLVMAILAVSVVGQAALAGELSEKCVIAAEKAAERAYNNPHLLCFGEGMAIRFDAKTQPPMTEVSEGSFAIRVVVENYGANDGRFCSTQLFDVAVNAATCKAGDVKFIANVND